MRSFQELHLFATSKKEGLKKIKAWLDKYFTISQVHIQHELSSKEKKQQHSTKTDSIHAYPNMKLKIGVPLRGLNAMPSRTEARKCNHWATKGLYDLVRI